MNRDTSILPADPCPYFEMHTATVHPPRQAKPIALCLTVCRLAQEMKRRLDTTDEAKPLTDALTIFPYDAAPRFFCGADLEPPTEPNCTRLRLNQRCLPSFQEILAPFHLDTSLPQPEHSDC